MTHKSRLEDLRLEDFLAHIQESINRIFAYTKPLSQQDFLSNAVEHTLDKPLNAE